MARLVADDTHLYWIAGQTIGRVAKIGGTAQVLATPPGLADIAVDGTHVYWVANGMGGTGIVARTPKDGTGAVEILVTNQRQPSRLAVDDTAIYWTALDSTDNAFGALRKVGKTGGAPIPMQEHISPPIAVTVDATCVYWGNTNGDIMATRKNP